MNMNSKRTLPSAASFNQGGTGGDPPAKKPRPTPSKPKPRTWEDNFQALVRYKAQHGDCNVPQRYTEDPPLGHWITRLRHDKSVSEKKKARLNELGFSWETRKERFDKQWQSNFNVLKQFHAVHGHCMVPRDGSSHGNWVRAQRRRYKLGKLPVEHFQQLEELGFCWDLREDEQTSSAPARPPPKHKTKADIKWRRQYERLCAYQQREGHCMLPQRYEPDPALGTWVNQQRQQQTKGKLPPERLKLLQDIGFVWAESSQDEQWMAMHDRLLDFRNEHGHVRVPKGYVEEGEVTSLASWVKTQRWKYTQGKLRSDRLEMLNELGFVWNTRTGLDDQQSVVAGSTTSSNPPDEASAGKPTSPQRTSAAAKATMDMKKTATTPPLPTNPNNRTKNAILTSSKQRMSYVKQCRQDAAQRRREAFAKAVQEDPQLAAAAAAAAGRGTLNSLAFAAAAGRGVGLAGYPPSASALLAAVGSRRAVAQPFDQFDDAPASAANDMIAAALGASARQAQGPPLSDPPGHHIESKQE